MELHNNRPTTDSTRRLEKSAGELGSAPERVESARATATEQMRELADKNRAGQTRSSDTIELSATARLFQSGPLDPARTSLVDSLKAAYESGNLNTTERIERAAHNLLGGE